jgi:hypothetical protein
MAETKCATLGSEITLLLLGESKFLWCRDMLALVATNSLVRSTVLKARVDVTGRKFDFDWWVRDLLLKWLCGDERPMPMSFRSYILWAQKLIALSQHTGFPIR